MVSILKPYGAISDDEVAYIEPHPSGRFYVIDIFGSHLEISKEVYIQLKEKGVNELK